MTIERDPRGGFSNTLERGKEKLEGLYLWLAEFHYSTGPIISKSLGVMPEGQRYFYKKLTEKGIIKAFTVPTLRERLFMLTPLGRELARELTPKAVKYATESSKIAASNVRHNLAVQLAVLNRLTPGMEVTFERHLTFTTRDKVPDALLEKEGGLKIALEVEMTHKKTSRIYRGFFDHLKLMKGGFYGQVEYVFPTQLLRDNYWGKFSEKSWPVYEKRQGRLIDTKKVFQPKDELREQFVFSFEELS